MGKRWVQSYEAGFANFGDCRLVALMQAECLLRICLPFLGFAYRANLLFVFPSFSTAPIRWYDTKQNSWL